MSNSLRTHGRYSLWNSPDQIGVGSLSLLQGIIPTQVLNPGLPHCRQFLYQLKHKGSPRILEWVAYPFSGRSSRPRNRTRVPCISGGLFTNWAVRKVSYRLHSANFLLCPHMVEGVSKPSGASSIKVLILFMRALSLRHNHFPKASLSNTILLRISFQLHI